MPDIEIATENCRSIIPLIRAPSDDLIDSLRTSILTALHEGTAEAGCRLPSIREVAGSCGTTAYAAMRAYETLEADGIVEKRERSGIFIASLGETPPSPIPETAQWLRDVITEGYLLRVKLPGLPELIQRWTGSVPLRFACIDATEDVRFALCDDVRTQFGVATSGVAVGQVGFGDMDRGVRDALENSVRNADVVVTTPFQAPAIRSLCARLGVPMIVATVDAGCTTAVSRYLERTGSLALICVDRTFGERMMLSLANGSRGKIVIVLASDLAGIRALESQRPALVTRAARELLVGEELRLLLPQYPAFSRRFAERVAHTILQLNLQGLRDRARGV